MTSFEDVYFFIMAKTGKEYYRLSFIDYKCPQCGKNFRASKWKKGKCCSIHCGKLKDELKPRECLQCKKIFKPRQIKMHGRITQRYCSHKCYSKSRIGIKGKNHFNYKREKKNCAFCGKEMMMIPFYKDKNRTCSKKCASLLKSRNTFGDKCHFWVGGISFEPYGLEFNRQLKRKIRERDNFRCQQCFREQDELYDKNGKKYSLIIHHIDYDKKNNDENNLISLCRNCHSQTNFKREDWINYFQQKI